MKGQMAQLAWNMYWSKVNRIAEANGVEVYACPTQRMTFLDTVVNGRLFGALELYAAHVYNHDKKESSRW